VKDHIRVTRGIWKARDWGGPYIEVYPGNSASAVDCINCWDYATGSRDMSHPYTRRHLDDALRRWIREQGATYSREYNNY